MFEHDNEVVNRSGNRPFQDILRTRLSRRGAYGESPCLPLVLRWRLLVTSPLLKQPMLLRVRSALLREVPF